MQVTLSRWTTSVFTTTIQTKRLTGTGIKEIWPVIPCLNRNRPACKSSWKSFATLKMTYESTSGRESQT